MKTNYYGALPSQHLRGLIYNGFISNVEDESIKPASLDLQITDEVYEIAGTFQVSYNTSVFEVLKQIEHTRVSLEDPLQVGKCYLAKIKEKIDLPGGVYAYANPKSTTGRLDMHVRLLADRVPQYDALPSGFKGELWVTIKPQSFSIKFQAGVSLNQIRLFYSDTRLSRIELEETMQKDGLLFIEDRQNPGEKSKVAYKQMQIQDSPDSIVLCLDGLRQNGDCVGYRAKKTENIIEYSQKYESADFFDQILPEKNGLIFLPRDCFCILSSIESVSVPASFACEMASIDDRFGDFRAHYAGFIDPGWGAGSQGRPLTLEVRPFEGMYVRHGQPIARIKFERIAEIPDITYDTIASNYTNQMKAKLAKQFL